MFKKIKGFEDLDGTECVDCYISTDSAEAEEILASMGLVDGENPQSPDRESLWDLGITEGFSFPFHNPKMGIEYACADVCLDHALKINEAAGFVPMSMIRVYTNGTRRVEAVVLPLFKALQAERQNVAFVDSTGSQIHVQLSEFYR